METAINTKIKFLQTAAISYIIAGFGFLYFGFPFWFLHTVDDNPKGQLIAPFVFLQQGGFSLILKSLNQIITSIALFIGAYSLFKCGEPTGPGKKQQVFFVSMAGAICYFLGTWLILPFTPMGAFLNALGMILIGIKNFKSGIWKGWKRYAPLLVGIFPFIFMYPLLILTKHRPAFMIGFWGFPWILLGIAAWQRSKQISLQVINNISITKKQASFK